MTMTTDPPATIDAFGNPVIRVEQSPEQLEIERLTHDLHLIAGMLLEEAQRRSWCSEYEEFIEAVNHRCYGEWLLPMARPTTYTIRLQINTDTADRDETETEIRESLESWALGNYGEHDPAVSVTY